MTMKHVISFKNLVKTVLFLGISFTTLLACTEPVKESKQNDTETVTSDASKGNVILDDLIRWNALSGADSNEIKTILNVETMYFSIDNEMIKDGSSHIHIYPALNSNKELYFNIVTSNEDKNSNYVLSSSRNTNLNSLDSNDLQFAKYFDKNNPNSPHHISAQHAYNRVNHWNESNSRNTWITHSLNTFTCKNNEVGKLNPVFSVFVMNVEDFKPLDNHYAIMAINDSTQSADLIVINTSTSGNDLTYISQDLVKSIPPCKPSFDINNYSVLNSVATNL